MQHQVLQQFGDVESFLREHDISPATCTKLSYWSTAAQKVFLVQPSSAAAERVFSILNRFSDTQTNFLEDYVESTLMLQYNHQKS